MFWDEDQGARLPREQQWHAGADPVPSAPPAPVDSHPVMPEDKLTGISPRPQIPDEEDWRYSPEESTNVQMQPWVRCCKNQV